MNDRIDAHDPRLSAWLLGELSGDERDDLEARIAADPDAARLVDELREAAAALEADLRAEPAPALQAHQRERIGAAAGSPAVRRVPMARTLAAAAALVAATVALTRTPDAPGDAPLEGLVADETILDEWMERGADGGESSIALFVPASKPGAFAAGGPRIGGGGGGGYRGPGDSTPAGGRGRRAGNAPGANPAYRASLAAVVTARGAAVSPPAGDARLRAKFELTRELVTQQPVPPPPTGPTTVGPAGLVFEAGAGETYVAPPENPFVRADEDPMSTFSIDVDTASYANARRHLRAGALPPPASVRLEEFVNYFRYDDPAPVGDIPFSVTTEVAGCPWEPRHQLVRIGLKGRDIAWSQRPASNLVFLIDVSGSMRSPDKLPLLVRSMKLLVEQLDARDSVAIVVYAGASGVVLPATTGNLHAEILAALDGLQAGGSTNGGEGIQLAYRIATERFLGGGVNRVVLATDGDFNVGVTSRDELVALIEEKRATGVHLSVLGFGTGNLNDAGMEQLADKGNGAYHYVDSIEEGRRVLVDQIGGTLLTIAKDVKIQVAFNGQAIRAWRLLGYENRLLAHEDFDDDSKDAGEIGAGVSCTALYEVVPVGQPLPGGVEARPASDFPLPSMARGMPYDELMLVRLRYKAPDGDRSRLLESKVRAAQTAWSGASTDMRFAAAAAAFAMRLRGSAHQAALSWDDLYTMAYQARGEDRGGYRMELVELIRTAKDLAAAAAKGPKGGP